MWLLPDDVFYCVFEFLSTKEILTPRCVCHWFREIVNRIVKKQSDYFSMRVQLVSLSQHYKNSFLFTIEVIFPDVHFAKGSNGSVHLLICNLNHYHRFSIPIAPFTFDITHSKKNIRVTDDGLSLIVKNKHVLTHYNLYTQKWKHVDFIKIPNCFRNIPCNPVFQEMKHHPFQLNSQYRIFRSYSSYVIYQPLTQTFKQIEFGTFKRCKFVGMVDDTIYFRRYIAYYSVPSSSKSVNFSSANLVSNKILRLVFNNPPIFNKTVLGLDHTSIFELGVREFGRFSVALSDFSPSESSDILSVTNYNLSELMKTYPECMSLLLNC